MKWNMFFITILACFLSKFGYAEDSGDAQGNAMGKGLYNLSSARLLPKGEKRFSTLGNLRWGISENWEIGSNLLLDVGQNIELPRKDPALPNISIKHRLPNISIKHRMLTFGRHQTSFVSQSGFWFLDAKQPTLSSMLTLSINGFGSLHGLMHTFDLRESGSQSLHLGLQQMLLSFDTALSQGRSSSLKYSTWVESYLVSVGFDQHLGSDFALSFLAQAWIPRAVEIDSAQSETRMVNETSLVDNLFQGTSLSQRTLIVNFTSFFEWGEVELGTVLGGSMNQPYANIIWRI